MEQRDVRSQTSLLIATVAGDVHDIGKNLVDIILTNNGYKVHNLGIKVPAEEIIARAKSLDVDLIGLSGLLVKSALLMKDNLAQFKDAGLTQPVLLGGAALTPRYVAEECVPRYGAEVIYCADAFAGLKAVREFEAGELLSTQVKDKPLAGARPGLRQVDIDLGVPVPKAPFIGARVQKEIDPALLYPLINEQALFRGRWGYRRAKLSKQAYEDLVQSEVEPAYARIKEEAATDGLVQPQACWGYFPCHSEGEELVLEHQGKRYPFGFPRQGFPPHLCITNYFRSADVGGDLCGLLVVTLGPRLGQKTQSLYEAGAYKDYLLWHGFGVELTDALAEHWHKQMRVELGIAEEEPHTVNDFVVQKYRGSRYGFGYPACPDLELQRPTFELLRPEAIGVSLTETCEMVPEMTTSALVAHHPQAKYFAV